MCNRRRLLKTKSLIFIFFIISFYNFKNRIYQTDVQIFVNASTVLGGVGESNEKLEN